MGREWIMTGKELTINPWDIKKRSSLTSELIRKIIHMLIGFVPLFAARDLQTTIYVVALGLFAYTFNEYLRYKGKRSCSLVSRITELASRERDRGHFVLGPSTLLLGVLFALVFFPHPASALAIYALAFGDGLASLVGKVWGRIGPSYLGGKTLEGSFACFLAVYLASLGVLHDVGSALLTAVFATFLEAIPLKDYDNILIPLGTGLFTFFLLG